MGFGAALIAGFLLLQTTAQPYKSRRHSELSRRRFAKRQESFLTTTQPYGLASGSATSDEGCTLWIQPSDGDSCLSIITYSPGLSLEDFLGLNSEIDSGCSNLSSGSWYCIDTDDEHVESASATTRNAMKATKTACKPMSKSAAASVTATASSSSKPKTKKPSASGSSKSGLLKMDDPRCGESGATSTIDSRSGPNGAISWMNCGISKSDSSGQWTPPNVTMADIKYQELDKNGYFAPCAPYFPYFEAAEKTHNIPAIFFAAFAMQESSCNPTASGDDGGAWGLMQITTDKCGSAPGGNCNDPQYNVNTGADYFVKMLAQNNNNPFLAAGAYNGWYEGLTYAAATKDACASCCCECQNNLDYLHQLFNCAIHNKPVGDCVNYNNLAICSTF